MKLCTSCFLSKYMSYLKIFSGIFPHGMTRHNYKDYENILKCDKCETEHIEIHKSFSFWCIIVNFFEANQS